MRGSRVLLISCTYRHLSTSDSMHVSGRCRLRAGHARRRRSLSEVSGCRNEKEPLERTLLWNTIVIDRAKREPAKLRELLKDPDIARVFEKAQWSPVPVLVRVDLQDGGKLKVLDGLRRVIAAVRDGYDTVEAWVGIWPRRSCRRERVRRCRCFRRSVASSSLRRRPRGSTDRDAEIVSGEMRVVTSSGSSSRRWGDICSGDQRCSRR